MLELIELSNGERYDVDARGYSCQVMVVYIAGSSFLEIAEVEEGQERRVAVLEKVGESFSFSNTRYRLIGRDTFVRVVIAKQWLI